MEASLQLPVGVQSRLLGSKKALRKRGNCSNSKTPDSWHHREACLGLGKSALGSMQMAPLGALQRDPEDLLGVMRAMDRLAGMETRITHPAKPGVAKG